MVGEGGGERRGEILFGRGEEPGHVPVVTAREKTEALKAAREAGIDLSLLDANLALSVKERWQQHDAALKFSQQLSDARLKADAQLHRPAREAR